MLIPRYGASLAAFTGIEIVGPTLCHGITNMPAPCLIASTIFAVTASYTLNRDCEPTICSIPISRALRERRTIPALPCAREAGLRILAERRRVVSHDKRGRIEEIKALRFVVPVSTGRRQAVSKGWYLRRDRLRNFVSRDRACVFEARANIGSRVAAHFD